MALILKNLCVSRCITSQLQARLASTNVCGKEYKCKLLIVGGGAGGCSVAWRLARRLQPNEICVLDGAKYHYYQPHLPLVAAGMRALDASRKPMRSVLPPAVCFVNDYAQEFDPCQCFVRTQGGDRIYYDFLVVAVGLEKDYEKIPGLKTALDDRCGPVCSVYSPQYCTKTWDVIRKTKGGHAIFAYIGEEGKCAGAVQQIMYLADDYFRQRKTSDLFNITYNASAAAAPAPKHASTLVRAAERRGVAVNRCCELVEVTPKYAVFQTQGAPIVLPYNLLHVSPPSRPIAALASSRLAAGGALGVDARTLQHRRFQNVFGLGDCTDTPNAKTAAAAGRQSYIVEQNLSKTMSGQPATHKYDGYGACVLLTSRRAGIFAESLYNNISHETFPIDQSKERRLFHFLKLHYFPRLYWNKIIKGKWDGPERARRFLRPFHRTRKPTQ